MQPTLRKLIANFAKRSNNQISQGDAGELFARKWFERNNIEYFQFPQCRTTMPLSLAQAGGKRPDFAISLAPGDSIVYVDAKFHQTKDVTEFVLTDEELRKFEAFRTWVKTECADDGDCDILLMVYPKELDGAKFTWVHLNELLNSNHVAAVDNKPGKKIILTDRDDLWMHQDETSAA